MQEDLLYSSRHVIQDVSSSLSVYRFSFQLFWYIMFSCSRYRHVNTYRQPIITRHYTPPGLRNIIVIGQPERGVIYGYPAIVAIRSSADDKLKQAIATENSNIKTHQRTFFTSFLLALQPNLPASYLATSLAHCI